MMSLGLSVPHELAYRRQLASSYTLKTTIQILDLEHNVIADVSHMLRSGGVDLELVEAEEDAEDVAVQATYSCVLLDPARKISLDSRSPADAAVFLDRMLKVYESVYVDQPELQGWVDCAVFCGPINKFERDDIIIDVEAQSKEEIALARCKRNATYKGNKVAAVRDMLLDTGEAAQYIDFPVHNSVTAAKGIVFVWETRPWAKAWTLVQSMAQTLFYDGRGVARMADNSSKVCFTFDGTMVSEAPQTSTDSSKIRNAVKVIGSKSSISYTAELDPSHPLSATSLGRRGKKQYLMDDPITNTDLTKLAQVTTLAKKELAEKSRTVTETTFEVFPVWNLEIGDLVFVDVAEYTGEVRVTSLTKPSTVKDNMSVGYTRETSMPNLSRIRTP